MDWRDYRGATFAADVEKCEVSSPLAVDAQQGVAKERRMGGHDHLTGPRFASVCEFPEELSDQLQAARMYAVFWLLEPDQ